MLTPEEVNDKEFTTVRLREGYDPDEVDAFLDEVVIALAELSTKKDLAERDTSTLRKRVRSLEEERETNSQAEKPSVTAARILELAQDAANRAVGEATEQAESLLKTATSEYETQVLETKSKVKVLLEEAQEEAEKLREEAEEVYNQTMGRLHQEKQELQESVNLLKGVEDTVYTRVSSFLKHQMSQIPAKRSSDDE